VHRGRIGRSRQDARDERAFWRVFDLVKRGRSFAFEERQLLVVVVELFCLDRARGVCAAQPRLVL
jgi:hypothetical protein